MPVAILHVPGMTARLRPFVFLIAISACAIVAYNLRIRHEMVDVLTWRRAVVRGLGAEPLYRPEDGHYQYKYLPMSALLMAPFGWLDAETGKMIWFAIEVGLHPDPATAATRGGALIEELAEQIA